MRMVPLEADMTKLFDVKDLNNLTVDQINQKVRKAFEYDEYKWQKENKIAIKDKNRAKNIHKVLYQCPSCKTEHEMDSDSNLIWCKKCLKTYEMDVYGALKS